MDNYFISKLNETCSALCPRDCDCLTLWVWDYVRSEMRLFRVLRISTMIHARTGRIIQSADLARWLANEGLN